MSTKYTLGKEVPTKILCDRLNELSKAVTNGRDSISREFYMRIPAEVDNDADLVIGEASCRILRLEKELSDLKDITITIKNCIDFTRWLEGLSPSQRVTVWSKDGSMKGIFTMDNEQLLEKYLRELRKPDKDGAK